MKVGASILNCNFLRLEEELARVQEAGVDLLHLDVMDGHFVPNISFGLPILKSIRPVVKVPIFTHLMIFYPEKMLDSFIEYSDGVIFHYEATSEPASCIKIIKKNKRLAGMAINPQTPVTVVKKYIEQLDEILIMSVNPGFGGQKFMSTSLRRIRAVKKLVAEKKNNLMIGVDGGISPDNAKSVITAGADILIAGSAIFRSSDYKIVVEKLRCLK
jgi:ribulose-phosphate 3-epimerase